MKTIVQESIAFLEICHKLKLAEIKKKDIAGVLEIPAPVLSSLLKTVLPAIASLNPGMTDEKLEANIAEAFLMVNNLSRTRIEKRLSDDIAKLTKRFENNDFNKNVNPDYLNFLRIQAEESFRYIENHLQGVYYFYYLSSDTDQLKGDPFLIKPNELEKIVEVYKGNDQSSVIYFGIALVNNKHTLTLQLAENHDSPEEYLQVVLSLPFVRKIDYLRGVFSSLNFTRQPIARKVILHKISDQCDLDYFNTLPVKRFTAKNDLGIPEIKRYLSGTASKIECLAITKPAFNLTDLDLEIKIKDELST